MFLICRNFELVSLSGPGQPGLFLLTYDRDCPELVSVREFSAEVDNYHSIHLGFVLLCSPYSGNSPNLIFHNAMRILRYILAAFVWIIISCDNDVNINVPEPNNFPPDGSDCLKGEGPVVMQSRSIASPYQRIRSDIFAEVLITQGPFEDIILEGQQNILDQISIEIINSTLRLELDRCINVEEAVTIYITLPDIESLVQAGVGDFIAQNDFLLSDLQVDLEGVGDIHLRGAVEMLDIELDPGVGNIRAFDLISDFCNVRLEGVGDVEVYVNEELEVLLSGVGDVYYKGNPIINSTITGTGAVIDAN